MNRRPAKVVVSIVGTLAGTTACSPTPSVAPPPVVVTDDVQPAPSSRGAAPTPDVNALRWVSTPEGGGCVVDGLPPDGITLAIAPHGRPGVRVHRADTGTVRLLSETNVASVYGFARLATDGFELRGWTTGDMPLYLQRPVLVGGYALPYDSTAVKVTTLHGARPVVTFNPEGVQIASPPTAELPCDQIGTSQSDRGYSGWLQATAHGRVDMAELTALPIPFSTEVDGPPTGTLLGIPPRAVGLIERRAGRARIRIFTTNAAIVGWVDGQHVKPSRTPASPPGRYRHRSRRGRVRSSVQIVTCDHPVRVVLEMEGRRRIVGTISSRVEIHLERVGPPFRRLGPTFFSVEEGARLLVPADDAAGCETY